MSGPNAAGLTRVPAGQTYSTLASLVAPGFVGYVIARCAFSPTRGFAIISDFGMRNTATGYLAEVIDVGDNRVHRVQSLTSPRKMPRLEVATLEDL